MAFLSDMKTKKTKKTEKLLEDKVVEAPSTAPEPVEVKIAAFSGEFGRADINLLRDKVNEIIDYLNK